MFVDDHDPSTNKDLCCYWYAFYDAVKSFEFYSTLWNRFQQIVMMMMRTNADTLIIIISLVSFRPKTGNFVYNALFDFLVRVSTNMQRRAF